MVWTVRLLVVSALETCLGLLIFVNIPATPPNNLFSLDLLQRKNFLLTCHYYNQLCDQT